MVFYYLGFNIQGNKVNGYTYNPSNELSNGIVITTLKIVKIYPPKKASEQISFFIYLAQFTSMNNLLINALQNIVKTKSYYIPWMLYIINEINNGALFSHAIQKINHYFDPAIISILSVGEKAGQFAHSCKMIVQYMKKQDQIRKLFRKHMRYPILVLSVLILIIVIFILYIFPDIASDNDKMKETVIYSIYENFNIIILFSVSTLLFIWLLIKRNKAFFHKVIIKIPFIGKVIVTNGLLGFFSQLLFLAESNIKGLEALYIIENNCNNHFMQNIVLNMINDIKYGKSLIESFTHLNLPNEYYILLQSKSSNMQDIYQNIIDNLFTEQMNILDIMDSYLQPMLIIIIGILTISAYYIIMSSIYYAI